MAKQVNISWDGDDLCQGHVVSDGHIGYLKIGGLHIFQFLCPWAQLKLVKITKWCLYGSSIVLDCNCCDLERPWPRKMCLHFGPDNLYCVGFSGEQCWNNWADWAKEQGHHSPGISSVTRWSKTTKLKSGLVNVVWVFVNKGSYLCHFWLFYHIATMQSMWPSKKLMTMKLDFVYVTWPRP